MLRRGYRVAAEMVRAHPGPFSVSVVGAAVFAGGSVLSTVVLGRLVDDVVLPTFETDQVDSTTLVWAAVAVMGVTIGRSLGVVTRRYFAGMTSERNQMTYRQRLVDRYLGMPLSWHRQTSAGRLLAHAESDTEVTTTLLHPLPFSLGVGFLAIFSAIALFAVDWIIAVVALTVFPAMIVTSRIYSRHVEGPAMEVQAGVGRISSIAHESFDGALIVKTLGRSSEESERFDQAVATLRSRRVDVGYIRAIFQAFTEGLPAIGMVAVVIVGARRIGSGDMTQGDLVQVISLFNVLIPPIRVFGFLLESLPPSVAARDRMEFVLGEDVPSPQTGALLPNNALGVELDSVSFSYEPTSPILDDVSASVAPGEVVAIVGSTGAGKSTLATLLAGLMPTTNGGITIGGFALDEIDETSLVDNVSLVFQESFLFADTLRANIDLDESAAPDDIESVLETALINRFIDDLPHGLDTILGERGVTLSGGQRQRVALARALIRKPRLLLLDDATSAVDSVVEQEILARLRTDLNTTTIIVAQRLSTIELADRVLYLSDGRIAGQGSHSDLMENDDYRSLVSAYEEASR